jgi:hypothetical protein
LLNIYEVDLLKVIRLNQAKLKTRYADGFTTAASVARVDVEGLDQGLIDNILSHCLNSHMTPKQYEGLKDLIDTKQTPLPNWDDVDPIPYEQKPISLKCYNCRGSFSSDKIKYFDTDPYCEKCYIDKGQCPTCGSRDLFDPAKDFCANCIDYGYVDTAAECAGCHEAKGVLLYDGAMYCMECHKDVLVLARASNCDSGEVDPDESDCVSCVVAEGVLSYDGDLFCRECYSDVLALAGAWVCGCGSAMSEEQRINFGVCEGCFNE